MYHKVVEKKYKFKKTNGANPDCFSCDKVQSKNTWIGFKFNTNWNTSNEYQMVKIKNNVFSNVEVNYLIQTTGKCYISDVLPSKNAPQIWFYKLQLCCRNLTSFTSLKVLSNAMNNDNNRWLERNTIQFTGSQSFLWTLESQTFLKSVFGLRHLATYISLFSVLEPGLGVIGIDPVMVLTPFPCSIWKRRDLNPRPFGCEPSLLTTTPSSHSKVKLSPQSQMYLWWTSKTENKWFFIVLFCNLLNVL